MSAASAPGPLIPPDLGGPAVPGGGAGVDLPVRSGWRSTLHAFLRNRRGVLGLSIVGFFLLFSFVGPLLYQTDQTHPDLTLLNMPPGAGHPLGTDDLGYDVLGRLMIGGQTSLIIGVGAAVLATGFGVLWGAISGYVGGVTDTVMMRVVDTFMAVPALFLLLVLAAIFRPSIGMLIVVLAVVSWLYTARLVRAETLSLRSRDYIAAARVAGASNLRILTRHIIPNTIGTIAVNVTFQVADAILLVASLSFLGLGVQPPDTNWGAMLSKGTSYIFSGYWWEIYPAGLAIVLTVVAFNLMGDALRDSLEIRLRER